MKARPIVYLGPSLPIAEARGLLEADFRPPARRGDLAGLGPEVRVVGLIDGVFDQSLAVSPAEVRALLGRGVTVVGGASMGALRAVELGSLGMIGVGAVVADYASGRLTADDEVAVAFDPETLRPVSVALVTLRHAAARAEREGLFDTGAASAFVAAAAALPYPDRSVRAALRGASIRDEDGAVCRTLSAWDVKAEDARLVLATLAVF